VRRPNSGQDFFEKAIYAPYNAKIRIKVLGSFDRIFGQGNTILTRFDIEPA